MDKDYNPKKCEHARSPYSILNPQEPGRAVPFMCIGRGNYVRTAANLELPKPGAKCFNEYPTPDSSRNQLKGPAANSSFPGHEEDKDNNVTNREKSLVKDDEGSYAMDVQEKGDYGSPKKKSSSANAKKEACLPSSVSRDATNWSSNTETAASSNIPNPNKLQDVQDHVFRVISKSMQPLLTTPHVSEETLFNEAKKKFSSMHPNSLLVDEKTSTNAMSNSKENMAESPLKEVKHGERSNAALATAFINQLPASLNHRQPGPIQIEDESDGEGAEEGALSDFKKNYDSSETLVVASAASANRKTMGLSPNKKSKGNKQKPRKNRK